MQVLYEMEFETQKSDKKHYVMSDIYIGNILADYKNDTIGK